MTAQTPDEEPAVPAEDPIETQVTISQLFAVNYRQITESLGILGVKEPTNKIDNINWRIALLNVARDLTIYDADARRAP